MPTRSCRLARVALPVVVLALMLAACGSAATPEPSSTLETSPGASGLASADPSPSPGSSPSAAASATSPPGSPSPSPSVGQTDTEWGRIWDGVPAAFPTYPGSTTTEVGHASSDQRVATATVDEVTTWYQAELETAGFSTEALSGPFEDGSMVIDSVGEPLECRVQLRIGPLGELVVIDILYGTACPFS